MNNKIRELIVNEIYLFEKEQIQSDAELKKEIALFGTTELKISIAEKEIQEQLKKIKALKSENSKRFKEISKFMIKFNKNVVKVKKTLAKLETKLKYTRIQPDYKTLWLNALSKLNKATVEILKGMENAQIELKKKETHQQLSITTEGVLNTLKNLWNSMLTMIRGFKKFDDAVSTLPKV